jgi:nucleotide-binding universal stress UspA family protein
MKNAGSVETVASAADAKTIPCGIVTRPVRKVLLPVDFSKPSIASVGYGTALALRAGAALHLIHIFEVANAAADRSSTSVHAPTNEEAFAELDRRLAELANQHSSPSLTVTSEVRIGNAMEEIMMVATALEIDLIVISTHSRTCFERFLLGSLADKIVREAPCPVLVVRKGLGLPTSSVAKPAPLILQILVLTDLSPHSLEICRYAGGFAHQFGARVTLVHFLPIINADGMSAYPVSESSLMAQHARKVAENTIADAMRTFTHDEVIAKHAVVSGPLFAELPAFVQAGGFDLIICTTHGFSGFLHALMGSTEELLVREVPCPVLVVRMPFRHRI